ncbi:Uncharacterised protein [Vibrio cholerae]|nr:Uncharacterised protein [Vibrio cholerae]
MTRLVSRVPPLLYSPRAVLRKVPVPLLSSLRVTFSSLMRRR